LSERVDGQRGKREGDEACFKNIHVSTFLGVVEMF
jgi:hypothetical protein